MRLLIILMSALLILSSCSQNNSQKTLKISTNSWIGYAPLFYANEKGYLEKLGIKLITNVSLAEAAEVFHMGKAQIVTTTQHEYYTLKSDYPSLTPFILLDRSDGGDLILSNKTISQLKDAQQIYAYLEIDSINAEILKDFIKNNAVDMTKIKFINKDQAQIQDVTYTDKKAILIVTYTPYDIKLKQKGFKEIASTKNMNSIIVIDSLCAKKELLEANSQKLQKLKIVIDKSIEEIIKYPKESHMLVRGYIGNLNYREYIEALDTIKWINNPSTELLQRIKKLGYKEEYIIK